MVYSFEINYVQGSFSGFAAFDGCTEEEIKNIRDKTLRAIANETFLHISNGGDEVILPSEVVKTSVFTILSSDGEERQLHNF